MVSEGGKEPNASNLNTAVARVWLSGCTAVWAGVVFYSLPLLLGIIEEKQTTRLRFVEQYVESEPLVAGRISLSESQWPRPLLHYRLSVIG